MAILPLEPHPTPPLQRRGAARARGIALEATDATIAAELEAAVTSEMRLEFAVDRLRRADPEASAASRLVPWQALAIVGLIVAIGAGLWIDPRNAIALVFILGAIPSLAYLALRLAAVVEIAAGGVAAERRGRSPRTSCPIIPSWCRSIAKRRS